MDVNRLKREAQKLQGKAETFLKDHHDQLESGVSKVEGFAKSKSKTSKRDAQIDKVAGRLRGILPADEPEQREHGAPHEAKRPHPAKPKPNNMHTDAQPGSAKPSEPDKPAGPSSSGD